MAASLVGDTVAPLEVLNTRRDASPVLGEIESNTLFDAWGYMLGRFGIVDAVLGAVASLWQVYACAERDSRGQTRHQVGSSCSRSSHCQGACRVETLADWDRDAMYDNRRHDEEVDDRLDNAALLGNDSNNLLSQSVAGAIIGKLLNTNLGIVDCSDAWELAPSTIVLTNRTKVACKGRVFPGWKSWDPVGLQG